jgi:hypothetical protein
MAVKRGKGLRAYSMLLSSGSYDINCLGRNPKFLNGSKTVLLLYRMDVLGYLSDT